MRLSLVVLLSLIATGAAGLVYQVAWQRALGNAIGSAPVAIAVTLGVFLGGLSLGYALCGRWASNSRRPFLTYGILELGIGVWALGFPVLFGLLERATSGWSFAPPWSVPQGLLLASALVLPPTLAMGATVPFLTQALATRVERLTGTHALVYSANTLGAVVGALAAAYVLVPRLGLSTTIVRTAWVNIAVGVLFVLLWRWAPRERALAGVPASTPPTEARFGGATLRVLALLSGFVVLGLETVSVRLVGLVTGPTSFVFAQVVAVFVASIAIGSFAVSRLRRVPRWALWANQSLVAVSICALALTIDRWPYAAHLLRLVFQASPGGFFGHQAALTLALFAIYVVPVALMGATVPLVFHEWRSGLSDAGRSSGTLLAWNAAGCLAGSLACGLLLFAVLDLTRVVLATAVAAALSALVAAAPLGRRRVALAGGVLVAATLVTVWLPGHDDRRLVVGTYRTRTPLPFSYAGGAIFHEELASGRGFASIEHGPLATVGVVEQRGGRTIYVNGKSDSSTSGDAETLRLSAHLPALWARERSRVLVVGLGTGVTAGELTLYPDVERIDVAEISPAVVRALPHFDAFTRGMRHDERVTIRREDAAVMLRRTTERWDVIVSEPSNPWIAGNDRLFSLEFVGAAAERLEPGGVYLQWLQLYETDLETIARIATTVRAVFPALYAFRGTKNDLLLLAAKEPFTSEARQAAEATWSRLPELQASLAEIGVGSIAELLERQVHDFELLSFHVPDARPVTLDDGSLSARAAYGLFTGNTPGEEGLRSGRSGIDFLFDPAFRKRAITSE